MAESGGPTISVVVPAFRSAATLPALHERIVNVMEAGGYDFEFILVEDAGGDSTWQAIEHLVQADPRVRGMRLARNYGQHNALLCGIQAAKGDVIVTMDDDLQNPPEEIPRLLAKLSEGFDVVYGYPGTERHGLLRGIASRVSKLVLRKAMGAEVATMVSAFRVFRSDVVRGFRDYHNPTVNIDVLLTWGAARFAAIRVCQDERGAGRSGYTLSKLVHHAFNMLTGFTTVPLRIASVTGLFAGLLGLAVLLFVVIRYLVQGSPVPGFPFLAATIAIFAGVQLFALGVFGEYLARMHLRSMERPPFVIAETLGGGDEKRGGSLASE